MTKVKINCGEKQTNQFSPPPKIVNIDTRCSTRCVKNWTTYKQTPPIGHYCGCTKVPFFLKPELIEH